MGRTVCTEPQCLYKCEFTLPFYLQKLFAILKMVTKNAIEVPVSIYQYARHISELFRVHQDCSNFAHRQ